MQSLLTPLREHPTTSQTGAILRSLKEGHELTALDALGRFGCFRLAARIADLKADGWPVETELRTVNGKRIAVYTLSRGARQESWL